MGISFLHILPEAAEKCKHAEVTIGGGDHPLNVSYFSLLITFIFMLLIERVVSAGRDPCTASFNDCSTSSKCCALTTHPDEQSSDVHVITIPAKVEHSKNRFRHEHSKFLATIKNILCPLCECNGLCITLALFTHSVFEGMAVGLESNHSGVWLITLGILLHKWTTGMALSSFIANETVFVKYVMISIFCLGSPLGVLIGGSIQTTDLKVSAIFDSIAVGTLVYVGFEIIVHELFCEIQCRNTALRKWTAVVLGVFIIFGAITLESYYSCHHSHNCPIPCHGYSHH